MKHIFLMLVFALLFVSCSVLKKDTDKQEEKQEQVATEKEKTQKPLTDKQKQKQIEKAIKENRKKQLEENKRRDKEFAKKKKQEEREKKRKEKEQDNIIKNAAKTERERIKEERKREKESLLSSQKLAEQEIELQNKKQQELQEQERLEEKNRQEQEELLAKAQEQTQQEVEKQEQAQQEANLLEQERIKQEQERKAKEEEKKKFESLSTMEQIIYRMQHPEEETVTEKITEAENTYTQSSDSNSIITLTDKEKKKIIASKDKQEGNIFKRTYRKVFPKKVPRSSVYASLYKEKPLTIMIAYPWNRSTYDKASEMAYTACVRELSEKGYYILPALSFMDELKKDTTKNTQYLTAERIQSFKEKYNVDAVLLTTIYRVEKLWWSTNINVVAHYDLISTQSLDTLFVRHADFNYDSPMPVKEKNNKKLLNDPEQMLYLGLFERMQKYVFLDLPAGPYHKEHEKDKNRNSQKQEVKYKVNIKPS